MKFIKKAKEKYKEYAEKREIDAKRKKLFDDEKKEQRLRELEASADKQERLAKVLARRERAKTKLYQEAQRRKQARNKYLEQSSFAKGIDAVGGMFQLPDTSGNFDFGLGTPRRKKGKKKKGYDDFFSI